MKPTLPPWLVVLCRIVLVVFIPVILTLTNVRLLLTPLLPEIEYRLPGFPADPYGFTLENRLRGVKMSIDFLLNSAGIDQAAKWTFADVGLPGASSPADSCEHAQSSDCTRWAASVGLSPDTPRSCTYFYNTCELKHLQDTKNIVRIALGVLGVCGALALLAAWALYSFGGRRALKAGLTGGAVLTAVIYLGVLGFIAINFSNVLLQFHETFFAQGTFTFLWSDSFIRMFPMRFWQDCFIFVGGGSLLEAGLLVWVGWRIRP